MIVRLAASAGVAFLYHNFSRMSIILCLTATHLRCDRTKLVCRLEERRTR